MRASDLMSKAFDKTKTAQQLNIIVSVPGSETGSQVRIRNMAKNVEAKSVGRATVQPALTRGTQSRGEVRQKAVVANTPNPTSPQSRP